MVGWGGIGPLPPLEDITTYYLICLIPQASGWRGGVGPLPPLEDITAYYLICSIPQASGWRGGVGTGRSPSTPRRPSHGPGHTTRASRSKGKQANNLEFLLLIYGKNAGADSQLLLAKFLRNLAVRDFHQNLSPCYEF